MNEKKTDGWRADYARACAALYGEAAQIIGGRGGWYRISFGGGRASFTKYRQRDIEAMTKELLKRMDQKSGGTA